MGEQSGPYPSERLGLPAEKSGTTVTGDDEVIAMYLLTWPVE